MSPSDKTGEWCEVIHFCDELNRKIDGGHTDDIPSAVATTLLTAATRLYRALSQDEHRKVAAFDDRQVVTPTAVAVTVTSMLRAVNLNSFDLAMWFSGRPVEPNDDEQS